jgi:hypothetical protein
MAARRKEKIVVVINKTTIITMTFKRILYCSKYRYTYRRYAFKIQSEYHNIMKVLRHDITICIIANAIFYAHL